MYVAWIAVRIPSKREEEIDDHVERVIKEGARRWPETCHVYE